MHYVSFITNFIHTIYLILKDGLAVMSVDLGSQFMKIAIVKVNVSLLLISFKSTTLF